MRIHEDGAGPELRGQNVLLRPVVEADTPILEAILEEPGVRRWWGRASWDRVDTPNYVTFAIDVGGEVVGCIQFDEEHDPDYRRVEIDLFVSERYQNRGVGSDALRTSLTTSPACSATIASLWTRRSRTSAPSTSIASSGSARSA